MNQKKLMTYAAIGVGAYILWDKFLSPAAQAAANGSLATPQEQAQSAAATLSANLAQVLGTG